MSRNTRTTAAAVRDEVPPRTRTAAPSRPTRATAKAPDETAQVIPCAPARPTRVARAKATAKPASTMTSDGQSISRQPAPSRTASAKKVDADTGSSTIQRKSAPTARISKTASVPATTRKVTTTRAISTVKPLVIQDTVSLTRDLQAALRDATSSPSSNEVASSSATSSKSPSGSELDVLGRYLSRALVLSDRTTKATKATTTPADSNKVSESLDSSSVDYPSPTSQAKAASEKRQEIVLAKHVINAGLKTLLNVYNSGYRFPTPTSIPTPTEKKSTWKDVDVVKVVDACWQAFQTIDRLQPELETDSRTETPVEADGDPEVGKAEVKIGAVGSDDALISDKARKAILEMEKIRTVLVSRCWMLGMVSHSEISLSRIESHSRSACSTRNVLTSLARVKREYVASSIMMPLYQPPPSPSFAPESMSPSRRKDRKRRRHLV